LASRAGNEVIREAFSDRATRDRNCSNI